MMSEMEANKYKKFINSKQNNAAVEDFSGGTKRKFLDFYSPHKELTGKDKCFCRVLPNKNSGHYFFYEFKKHTFKYGSTYKTAVCTYSTNPLTESSLSDGCKFCDFINENKSSLSQDVVKKLQAKEAQVMLVYNYAADSVQKYETNYYGFMDITVLLSKLIEEGVSIDEEGFDLIFERDSNGYAKAVEAHAPKISLEDLFAKSVNVKEIPDLFGECVPNITPKWQASIDSVFEYGLKAFAPTFAANTNNATDYTDQTQSAPRQTTSNVSEYDPNADESNSSDETNITKSQFNPSNNKTDDTVSSDNNLLLDINSFVESFKQNQKQN